MNSQRITLDFEGLSAEGDLRYVGPPPQCFRCSRFVNVETARKIPEYGDYGSLLNMEFECERCVEGRKSA